MRRFLAATSLGVVVSLSLVGTAHADHVMEAEGGTICVANSTSQASSGASGGFVSSKLDITCTMPSNWLTADLALWAYYPTMTTTTRYVRVSTNGTVTQVLAPFSAKTGAVLVTTIPAAKAGQVLRAVTYSDSGGATTVPTPWDVVRVGVHEVPPDTTPPPAPTALAAVKSGADVAVSWNGSTDTTGYRIAIDGGAFQSQTASSYTHADASGASHTYDVQARDEAGNWSASSSVTYTYVAPPPPSPSPTPTPIEPSPTPTATATATPAPTTTVTVTATAPTNPNLPTEQESLDRIARMSVLGWGLTGFSLASVLAIMVRKI